MTASRSGGKRASSSGCGRPAFWNIEKVGIEWDWQVMDGAMTKAPLGGKGTGPNPTDRGKSGTKRSLLTEGKGIPLAVAVDSANRHDMKMVEETLGAIVIERPEPTEEKPQNLCMDKGYDYPQYANWSRSGAIQRTSVPVGKRSERRSEFPATAPGAGSLSGHTLGSTAFGGC